MDHRVEVSADPTLAFTWSNLYLSCHMCQQTLDEGTVSRASCVDPCDPATDPVQHIRFDDGVVQGVTGRGVATVRKYKLDSDAHTWRRYQALAVVLRALGVAEHRQRSSTLSDGEKAELWRLADAQHPYSSMFRCALEKSGIPRP